MVRLGVLALVLVATLSSSAAADDTPLLLRGVVGPDFTISFITATGQEVSHLDAGTYSVHVDDMSDFHNFHLKGPGVDLTTSVTDIDSYDWTVKLVDGTYTYVCDVHAATMKGSFTVGTVTRRLRLLRSARRC